MRDDAPSFRLAPTPAHLSDAEIGALFQMLEQERSDDGRAALPASSQIHAERSLPDRGACAAAGMIHNRGALLVPDRSDVDAEDGGAASQPPFSRELGAAFARYARAVAAQLNR